MPHNYDYSEPERLLSKARLTSYRTSLITRNNSQLFGAYCWNLAVVSAFYPLVQLIEVALRNAMNNVAQAKYFGSSGQYWFDLIPFNQDINDQGQSISAEQVKNFKANMKSAKKSAMRSLEEKGIVSSIPTLDQVISQTDFSTWEYLLDKHFYDGSNNHFLWPNGLSKVFKKLPRVGVRKNVAFHQRDIIRRRIEEVRVFRNRISHNEPAWRVNNVTAKEDVISTLTERLNGMMELLFWISPKFSQYVRDVGIEARIKQMLHLVEMNRYMQSFERHEINDIDNLIDLANRVNSENHRCYFNVSGKLGILVPCNTSLLQ
ncbi:Abi family protein [Photorhabdus sp. CRCIA-P01]|uniref:Abi family protein n=1 Tax=Photorhabdus sp. CRCIA-P01 TaxID=2019570 RepID=UPI000E59D041|nr:Abi family protein [Photorhabdus sp. CRCIA-P01]